MPERDDVSLPDVVCVCEGLHVGLGVSALLPDDDCDGVPVRLLVAVPLGVSVLLREPVWLGDPLQLGVCVRLLERV